MPSIAASAGRGPVSKAEKPGAPMAAQDLARAVGAEVQAEQPVTVLHAGVIADDGRCDEFVGLARRIGRLDRRSCAVSAGRPSALIIAP
jgi:hypothetical protein